MGLRKSLTTAVVAVVLVAQLAACGDSDDDDISAPKERGPQNVSGQSTCVYIDSPAECKDSGVPTERWFEAPDGEPQRSDSNYDFLMQLFMWQMIYHTWFSSPMYRDTYVVVEHRNSYGDRWSRFDKSYGSRYKTYEKKAVYTTRSGKTVTGDKVKTTNFQKPPAPKNGGGDRGKLCNAFTLDGLTRGGGGGGGSSGGGRSSGGSVSRSGTGSSVTKNTPPKPAPPKPAPVGGDRGKGGTSQHGC